MGGNVDNGASGSSGPLITGGGYGVLISGVFSATITNHGTISGAAGIGMASGGYGANQTVIDAGTIIGTSGTALGFGRDATTCCSYRRATCCSRAR